MGFGKLFGKSDASASSKGSSSGEAMSDSVHASATKFETHVLVEVKCEKIAEREGPILLEELAQAAQARNGRLVVDLAGVQMITSAGIGNLVQLHRKCHDAGGKLVLLRMNDDLKGLLKIARLDRLFTIADNTDKAISALK